MNKESTVLIIHPDKILLQRLINGIRAAGFIVFGGNNLADASVLAEVIQPKLVLIAPVAEADWNFIQDFHRRNPAAIVGIVAESEAMADTARSFGIAEIILRDTGIVGKAVDAVARRLPAAKGVGEPERDHVPVLLVDDDDGVREVFSQMLLSRGYRVVVAENGKEALETLNRDASIKIVLLDLMMPVMGGMETLRQIVSRQPHPEVILISALVDAEVAKLALRSGACDYLVKPFNADVLDQSIAACLAVADYRNRPWWKRWKA